MEKTDYYKHFGNITKKYEHRAQYALPEGFVMTPSLVLKLYVMNREPRSEKIEKIGVALNNTRHFLDEQIDAGKIAPLSGIGFAILSDGMLNVARWDVKYPHVIKNQLYGFDNVNKIHRAKPLDIRENGSFCIWELGIVNHEKEAWKRYLKSVRAESDKKTYLLDSISGRL